MARVRSTRQLIVIGVLLLAGCRHVAPYERGALARPDMTTSDLAGPAGRHRQVVHEGALPAGSVGASGCGCN